MVYLVGVERKRPVEGDVADVADVAVRLQEVLPWTLPMVADSPVQSSLALDTACRMHRELIHI